MAAGAEPMIDDPPDHSRVEPMGLAARLRSGGSGTMERDLFAHQFKIEVHPMIFLRQSESTLSLSHRKLRVGIE